MSDKPNPFLKLMNQVKADQAKKAEPATPQSEQKLFSESPKQDLTTETKSPTDISQSANEKKTEMVLTPAAQLLLGANNAVPDPAAATTSGQLIPSGTQELGAIDTTDMEEKTQREPNINVRAAAAGKLMQLDSAETVRGVLDQLDNLIEKHAAADLQGPPLIESRNYVQSIMVTLKTRPEFESVMIAKDVRNVMKFIRATRQEALELRELKTEKKAVRAANKERKESKQTKGFDQAFNKIMGLDFKL